MGKLYGLLAVLVLVFSAAMSFVTLGVYELTWWWSVIGIGILVVFLAIGPLVPKAVKAVPAADVKAAKGAMQLFGAFLATEFLLMAIICWALGGRSISDNNAYEILGLLIFLALLGAGAQGIVVTLARWMYYRNETVVARRDLVEHGSTSA